ncbi:hypothetical protein ONS95_003463 [Cadophora gregata]|uniref:uncharacterized protein n=1 Tax=Cadophora gregata TaxID=51156 RepID=UPI0026DB1EAE|nr:uncharacterized protein ONS95_003463 [Cadophora gregata]KAK0108671.1 hypothetical protein ONS95_003463 [Cadophora gregata]KAK0108739.1 hypothetical protein ONS96_002584 [Cadophora gregata f. sp. sojae]
MVGATSTTTTTTTTMSTNTTMEPIEIGCQTCGIQFDTREAQREHMRGDWHVYNLKRKMTSLPPIPRSEFENQILNSGKQKSKSDSESSSPSSDEDSASASEDDEDFTPTKCLFCPELSTSTPANLTHMSQAHDFTIPDISHLLDIDSFLGYLSITINCFHECLSCGSVKGSRAAVQDHMCAERHCRLNLVEDQLELGDFWEVSESENEGESGGEGGSGSENDENCEQRGEGKKGEGRVLEEGELRLPSGKILGRRSKTRTTKIKMSTSLSLSRSRSSSPPQQNIESQPQSHSPRPTNNTSSSPSSSALIPVRTSHLPPRTEHRIVPKPGTSTSLIGLSDVQQRALRATEMKMEKVETKARKVYEAKVDRKGNKQKTFRVLSIGKKAGGLEKRNG